MTKILLSGVFVCLCVCVFVCLCVCVCVCVFVHFQWRHPLDPEATRNDRLTQVTDLQSTGRGASMQESIVSGRGLGGEVETEKGRGGGEERRGQEDREEREERERLSREISGMKQRLKDATQRRAAAAVDERKGQAIDAGHGSSPSEKHSSVTGYGISISRAKIISQMRKNAAAGGGRGGGGRWNVVGKEPADAWVSHLGVDRTAQTARAPAMARFGFDEDNAARSATTTDDVDNPTQMKGSAGDVRTMLDRPQTAVLNQVSASSALGQRPNPRQAAMLTRPPTASISRPATASIHQAPVLTRPATRQLIASPQPRPLALRPPPSQDRRLPSLQPIAHPPMGYLLVITCLIEWTDLHLLTV